jgi:hypothetical protein
VRRESKNREKRPKTEGGESRERHKERVKKKTERTSIRLR